MTDKEIIAKGKEIIAKRIKKGLDCCDFEYPPCRHCPYQRCDLRDCKKILIKDAKYLVETQQSEIERLKEEHDKNFEKWEILDKRTKERYAELYEEAKGVVRAKAIKEFVEKLKGKVSLFSTIGTQEFADGAAEALEWYDKKVEETLNEMLGADNE